MDEPGTRRQRFSYTADRSGFVASAGGWILLLVLEGGVIATLIVIFAPGLVLKLVLLGLYVAGLLYLILAKFCAPLWTRHELLADRLVLRYGPASVSVARQSIAAAGPVEGKRGHRFRPGFEHDPGTNALVVTFSTRGMVELTLTEPESFDVADREPVDRIVFNVDQRDAFIEALAVTGPVRDRHAGATATVAPSAIGMAPPDAIHSHRVPHGADTFAISATGLVARFGERTVVNDLELTVRHGEIYGLLGANGAGKSTTLRMLVGLLAPSQGTIGIAGHDLDTDAIRAKSAFGYMPDRAILYDRLSGREFLQFLAHLRGVAGPDTERRIDGMLGRFDLTDRQHSPAASYSFGMKRKLSLAGALLHDPSALILDEPFNGLDPPGAHELRLLLAERANAGAGILLSTHDLAAAGSLADRIGIMHQGRLLAEGTVDELTSGIEGPASHRLEAAFLRLTGTLPETSNAPR